MLFYALKFLCLSLIAAECLIVYCLLNPLPHHHKFTNRVIDQQTLDAMNDKR
jgi:hypothetical protein